MAEEKIRNRSPTTKMSLAASRPKSFANPAHEGTAGPGAYDDGKRFDSDVKTFTIGEKKQRRIEPSAGPGQYDPELADEYTRAKAPRVNLGGNSPSRQDFTLKG